MYEYNPTKRNALLVRFRTIKRDVMFTSNVSPRPWAIQHYFSLVKSSLSMGTNQTGTVIKLCEVTKKCGPISPISKTNLNLNCSVQIEKYALTHLCVSVVIRCGLHLFSSFCVSKHPTLSPSLQVGPSLCQDHTDLEQAN
jgi:hypothetical protein